MLEVRPGPKLKHDHYDRPAFVEITRFACSISLAFDFSLIPYERSLADNEVQYL